MAKDVMAKYRAFVEDYRRGLDRKGLCAKYGIPEGKYEVFLSFLKRKGFRLELPSQTFASAHEIDFEVYGEDLQFVEVELDPGETAIAEAGAMMYMDQEIEMETIFGDGSARSNSVMAKIFGAGKRVLTGESLFMTAFTNRGARKARVAFGAPYPGKILPVYLPEVSGELLCQKDAFLCAAKGVSIDIAFQRKLGVGLFGGEGFILQRLRGEGYAFLHVGGAVMERTLEAGELLRVDTGCIAAFEAQVGTTFSLWGESRLPSSVARGSSLPPCAAPVAFGFNPYPSAVSRIGSSPPLQRRGEACGGRFHPWSLGRTDGWGQPLRASMDFTPAALGGAKGDSRSGAFRSLGEEFLKLGRTEDIRSPAEFTPDIHTFVPLD
jgi:uncharacterized protein (AIM24 family)